MYAIHFDDCDEITNNGSELSAEFALRALCHCKRSTVHNAEVRRSTAPSCRVSADAGSEH